MAVLKPYFDLSDELRFPGSVEGLIVISHAIGVLTSLENMRKESVACDFILKVGQRRFPVHRAVLITCSGYFQNFFNGFHKESIEGELELHDLDESSVDICVRFIYTGNYSSVTVKNAIAVLNAATYLQIEKLKILSLKVLEANITDRNCVSLLKMARLHDHESLARAAEKYLHDFFEMTTACEEFQNLSKDDALMIILEFGNSDETIWKAAKSWIEFDSTYRKDEVLDFFNMLCLDIFPSDSLIQDVYNASYLKQSELCMERFCRCIFSNISTFRNYLSIDNVFPLIFFADLYGYDVKEVRHALHNFMLENFTQVLNHEKFIELPLKKVISLFQSPRTIYFASERIKLNATLNLMHRNPAADEKTFCQLLKSVKILPKSIIFDTLCNEQLFKQYPEAESVLMAAMAESSTPVKDNAIAILRGNNAIDVYNFESKKWVPIHHTPCSNSVKMSSINGYLCLFDGRAIYLRKYQRFFKRSCLPEKLPENTVVIGLNERIFVLDTEFFYFFDTMTSCWSEKLLLPSAIKNHTCLPIKGNDRIFIVSSHPIDQNEFIGEEYFEWLVVPNDLSCNIIAGSSGAYFAGNLYVCTKKSCAQYIILRYSIQSKSWKQIKSPYIYMKPILLALGNSLYAFIHEEINDIFSLYRYSQEFDEWGRCFKIPSWMCFGNEVKAITSFAF